jgi:hypothetical protein
MTCRDSRPCCCQPAPSWVAPRAACCRQDVGGRLLESREVSHQGHPAREVSYEVAGPPSLRERALLILAGNRLYLVIATWSPTRDFALPLAQLLRSFELRLP